MIIPAIRTFLLAALLTIPLAATARNNSPNVPKKHNEATVAQLQKEMASGKLTSVELTKEYIARIAGLDQDGPGVNAVIELNPDALEMARTADALRRRGVILGPLHGIPVLVKDNVDTGDMMQTTAGSFALLGRPALQDSTVAANLRAGGAVILGKTNLSEWANFRSFESVSGWSGRGIGELCRSLLRDGDGWQHRVPSQCEWCGWPQANSWLDQSGWHCADLPHAGHFRSARTHRS